MHKFFKWLFRITTAKGGGYRAIYICGIRILCVKKRKKKLSIEQRIEEKLDFVCNFLKATTDITKIPQATGNLLIMQKASVCVLKRLSIICKKHNIKWWLSFGSLIGAVRHNGFIPWDDDIDICMLRDDYEKLNDILQNEFSKDGFGFSRKDAYRLFYKNTPAQVDVFPIDVGYQTCLPEKKQLDEFKIKLRQINEKYASQIYNGCGYVDIFFERDKFLMNNKPVCKDGFLFRGVEAVGENSEIFEQNDFFPLKAIKWCGVDAFIPKNYQYVLNSLFGDYMLFPEDCYPKHADILCKLNKQSLSDCKYLINMYKKSTK